MTGDPWRRRTIIDRISTLVAANVQASSHIIPVEIRVFLQSDMADASGIEERRKNRC